MDISIAAGGANCGSCGAENTVIPVELMDNGSINWRCTGCGEYY